MDHLRQVTQLGHQSYLPPMHRILKTVPLGIFCRKAEASCDIHERERHYTRECERKDPKVLRQSGIEVTCRRDALLATGDLRSTGNHSNDQATTSLSTRPCSAPCLPVCPLGLLCHCTTRRPVTTPTRRPRRAGVKIHPAPLTHIYSLTIINRT